MLALLLLIFHLFISAINILKTFNSVRAAYAFKFLVQKYLESDFFNQTKMEAWTRYTTFLKLSLNFSFFDCATENNHNLELSYRRGKVDNKC